jgi:hypothetical protein
MISTRRARAVRAQLPEQWMHLGFAVFNAGTVDGDVRSRIDGCVKA